MDSITMSVIGLVMSVVLAVFGIIFRRLSEMDKRLREAPDREEVRQLVSDKLEPTKVMHLELKEDVKDIKRCLEKLLERQ